MGAVPSAAAIVDRLNAAVGAANVDAGDDVSDDMCHDEALGLRPVRPARRRPPRLDRGGGRRRAAAAAESGVPAHRPGIGHRALGGRRAACRGGIVVSFERMAAIVEIDDGQPGGRGRARA